MTLLARRSAAIPVLMSLLLPASAGADIYKWTDEQGVTVYSNTLPDNPQKAANVERVVKERAAPLAEQKLLDRIEDLERRLQARSSPPPAPPEAPGVTPTYSPERSYSERNYSYPPLPPAYTSYATPVFYPVYRYPVTPAYSYVVYPRTFGARPPFHGAVRGALHTGFSHRGRR